MLMVALKEDVNIKNGKSMERYYYKDLLMINGCIDHGNLFHF
jgi:hypothetical protein